jgi:uncharacterized membrane protein
MENPYFPGQDGGVTPPSPQSKSTVFTMLLIGLVTGLCCSLISALVFDHYRRKYQQTDRFIGFYAFQGLYLAAATFVCLLLAGGLYVAAGNTGFTAFGVGNALTYLISIGYLVCVILMLIKAQAGELFELPIFGPMARKNSGN